MVIMISTIIGFIFIYEMLKFINKNEEEEYKVNVSIKSMTIVVGIILISTALLYIRYELSFQFFIFYIMSIYLILTSYIDFYTTNVYTFINIIFFSILSICILCYLKIGSELIEIVKGIIIMAGICSIFDFLSAWGKGDTEVLISISSCLGLKAISSFLNEPIKIFLIVITFSLVLISIISLLFLLRKKIGLKDKIAFVPCIAFFSITLSIFI